MSAPNDHRSLKDRRIATQWLETQRGRAQYRTAPPLSRDIGRIVKPFSKKYGGNVSDLSQNWPDIIGRKFARLTKPVKFTGSAKGRRLVISAPGPAAALLTASRTQILDRLNGYFGQDYVKDIYVVQSRMRAAGPHHSSVPKKGLSSQKLDQLQNGLETIDNPDLKAALEKLGRQVLSQE